MAKVRRKSIAPIPSSKALKLAAKRLGVADLDYVEIRLREQLRQAVYGDDWGVQAVHPPGTRIDDLWCDPSGSWEIKWELGRAETLGIAPGTGELAFEPGYGVGLWIAPAVIKRLVPVIAKPKPPVRISKYRRPLERAARRIIGRDGRPDTLQGEGGLLEKVTLEIGEENMPTAESWAVEILKPIHDEGRTG
jgi:hypothetical protein